MLFEPSNSLLIMVPFVVVFLLLCMYKFRDSDMNKNECTQLSLNFPDSNPGITKMKEAFQEESVPDGLELNSGSKLFLIPCCTLALRLPPAQAKNPGCPGILAWWTEVRGAQDSGEAGLPLSCVNVPSSSLSVVILETIQKYCWTVMLICESLGEWHESSILHKACRKTGRGWRQMQPLGTYTGQHDHKWTRLIKESKAVLLQNWNCSGS